VRFGGRQRTRFLIVFAEGAHLLARQGRAGRGQAISPAQADDAVRKWHTARNEKLIPST
jgi:hypothetical protein